MPPPSRSGPCRWCSEKARALDARRAARDRRTGRTSARWAATPGPVGARDQVPGLAVGQLLTGHRHRLRIRQEGPDVGRDRHGRVGEHVEVDVDDIVELGIGQRFPLGGRAQIVDRAQAQRFEVRQVGGCMAEKSVDRYSCPDPTVRLSAVAHPPRSRRLGRVWTGLGAPGDEVIARVSQTGTRRSIERVREFISCSDILNAVVEHSPSGRHPAPESAAPA